VSSRNYSPVIFISFDFERFTALTRLLFNFQRTFFCFKSKTDREIMDGFHDRLNLFFDFWRLFSQTKISRRV